MQEVENKMKQIGLRYLLEHLRRRCRKEGKEKKNRERKRGSNRNIDDDDNDRRTRDIQNSIYCSLKSQLSIIFSATGRWELVSLRIFHKYISFRIGFSCVRNINKHRKDVAAPM